MLCQPNPLWCASHHLEAKRPFTLTLTQVWEDDDDAARRWHGWVVVWRDARRWQHRDAEGGMRGHSGGTGRDGAGGDMGGQRRGGTWRVTMQAGDMGGWWHGRAVTRKGMAGWGHGSAGGQGIATMQKGMRTWHGDNVARMPWEYSNIEKEKKVCREKKKKWEDEHDILCLGWTWLACGG